MQYCLEKSFKARIDKLIFIPATSTQGSNCYGVTNARGIPLTSDNCMQVPIS